MAGKSFRLSANGRMLPRSTGWMRLERPAQTIAFLVAASYIDHDEELQETCIGSLFLLRKGGGSAARIPLIYGRNVWDWWTPAGGRVTEAPAELVAWRGENPHARSKEHGLALYRLEFSIAPGSAPIVAVSLGSHLRRPAPMLLAIEVVQ